MYIYSVSIVLWGVWYRWFRLASCSDNWLRLLSTSRYENVLFSSNYTQNMRHKLLKLFIQERENNKHTVDWLFLLFKKYIQISAYASHWIVIAFSISFNGMFSIEFIYTHNEHILLPSINVVRNIRMTSSFEDTCHSIEIYVQMHIQRNKWTSLISRPNQYYICTIIHWSLWRKKNWRNESVHTLWYVSGRRKGNKQHVKA